MIVGSETSSLKIQAGSGWTHNSIVRLLAVHLGSFGDNSKRRNLKRIEECIELMEEIHFLTKDAIANLDQVLFFLYRTLSASSSTHFLPPAATHKPLETEAEFVSAK